MDTQKDNAIMDTNNTHKTLDPISFFENDKSFVFVYKKTEKLATALYMVTNLFSEVEPIKWSLRKKVADLLSFIVGYKNVLPNQYIEFTGDIKTRVLEIVSLLEISYRSGLVSPMNFSILKEEFSRLLNAMDGMQSNYSESYHEKLKESFFSVSSQGLTYSNNQNRTRVEQVQSNNIKDSNIENNVFKKNNRQNIIINLLKKKKDLTIKDIALTIKDCSEKTIQRELISLINMGTIKKTGERRWSRYSLV